MFLLMLGAAAVLTIVHLAKCNLICRDRGQVLGLLMFVAGIGLWLLALKLSLPIADAMGLLGSEAKGTVAAGTTAVLLLGWVILESRILRRTASAKQASADSPDTPLETFIVRQRKRPRRNWRLAVRQHTLCFSDTRSDRTIVVDPRTGEYGLKLRGVFLSSDNIELIDRRGESAIFSAPGKVVALLRRWWRDRSSQ